MANPKHLKILKKGVVAWNKWRKKNPDISPNLRGAYLSGVELSGANLSGADLSEVDLTVANLSNTDLTGTDLVGANLSGANLMHANLTNAYLSNANFRVANLSKANLYGAILLETILGNTNLTDVKNLEFCDYSAPCTIDHRTLAKSGSLPIVFLRGVGLPEQIIEYLPSLLNHPLQFYSCFISYSHKDEEFVQRLHADLQDKGVRCWFAQKDLKIGSKIRVAIDEIIRVYDKLLLILSEHSIVSKWVEKEVETAFEKEHQQQKTVLFPVRLDDAVMETTEAWAADVRRTRHIGDFRNWKKRDSYQKAFERLLLDLKANAAKS